MPCAGVATDLDNMAREAVAMQVRNAQAATNKK